MVKKQIMFFLVLLIFPSFAYACLSDMANAEIILRPYPVIQIEFGEGIDLSTLDVSFSMYAFSEDDIVFPSPVDRTNILELLETSNESVLKYGLNQEIVHGNYYLIEVSAKTEDIFDSRGNLISPAYDMEQCKLMRADFGPLRVSLKHPKSGFLTESGEIMEFETTRRANCSISTMTDRLSRMSIMGETGEYVHQNIYMGSSSFFVGCTDGEEEIVRSFDVVLDTTPPTIPIIDDSTGLENHPNISTSLTRVRVRFESNDPESGVKQINYSIINKRTGNNVMNWALTETIGEYFFIIADSQNQLSLTDRQIYSIQAKAQNNAGLWSELSSSNGFEVYIDFNPSLVELDSRCEETGEDCADGHPCTENVTCRSGFCHPELEICATPLCDDGYKNQDETDVDCGGSCDGCQIGETCFKNSDCMSEYCDLISLICAERPVSETQQPEVAPIDRNFQDVDADDNLFFTIIIMVFALVFVGGVGYYSFLNKDKINYFFKSNLNIGSVFGANSSTKSSNNIDNNSQFQNTTSQNTTFQQSNRGNVATQLSRRLKNKENIRKRKDIFQSFSDEKEPSDISKSDIDQLFK